MGHPKLKGYEFGIESSLTGSIIKTLLYFDIFNYPLRQNEVYRFLDTKTSVFELSRVLEILVQRKYIFQHEGFYSVKTGTAHIERRIKGNQMASRMLPVAAQRAKLISYFPFVVSVMASGSLSKDYMDEKSDLDFFIITAPDRLWIARMLLVLYKRIFLGNSSKEFCVNYFIAQNALEIEEKNAFTATELATVIPLVNASHYNSLMDMNPWLLDFFPNYQRRDVATDTEQSPFIKSFLEKIFNIFGGAWLDSIFMRLTMKRWSDMYHKSYKENDFKIAFKSRKDVSKGHPKNYQAKVTEMLEAKWAWYRENFSLDSVS